MQQHGRKYFACRPLPPLILGLGLKGQNSTLSEHSHIAYLIKGNHELQQHGSKYFSHRLPDVPDLVSRQESSRQQATW